MAKNTVKEVSAKLHLYLELEEGQTKEEAQYRLDSMLEHFTSHFKGLSAQVHEWDYNEY